MESTPDLTAPRPWTADSWGVMDAEGNTIGNLDGLREPNRSFVLKAVNAYDALVAMVERLTEALESSLDDEFDHRAPDYRPSASDEDIAAAEALLASVQGTPEALGLAMGLKLQKLGVTLPELDEAIAADARTRNAHRERLVQAFVAETGLPPSKCELVEIRETTPTGWTVTVRVQKRRR